MNRTTKLLQHLVFFPLIVIILITSNRVHATIYYPDIFGSTGSQGLPRADVAGNWNSAPSGGGSNPANFSSSADTFDFYGRDSELGANWSVNGVILNTTGPNIQFYVHSFQIQFNGTVGIGSNVTMNGVSGTVEYAYSGASNIIGGTYNTLRISGEGTKTFQGNVSVSSTFNLNTSAATFTTLSLGTRSLTGNFSYTQTNASALMNIETSGTLTTQISNGIDWGDNVRLQMDGSLTQYVPSGRFGGLILSNGIKVISSGRHVVLTNTSTTLTHSASNLILEANSSGYGTLKAAAAKSGSGSIEKQFYLDISSGRWFYMGTGVTGAHLKDLRNGGNMIFGTGGSAWQYNSSNSNWEEPDSTGNNPSIGYTIFGGVSNGWNFLRTTSGTVSLSGGINTSDVTTTFNLNYHNGTGSNTTLASGSSWGWNLLANPYLAAYKWDGQSLPSNMNNAIYIWNGSNFTSYVNGAGTNGGTQNIAPGQAFFVQTTNGFSSSTFTFSHSQVSEALTDTIPSMFKSGNGIIRLQVSSDVLSVQDECVLRINDLATEHFDAKWDAVKMINGGKTPNLFIRQNSQNYSICSAPGGKDKTFSLNFEANEEGSYEIKITENDLNGAIVYLEDRLNGKYQLVSDGSTYSFTHKKTNASDRFVLHFSEPNGIETITIQKGYKAHYSKGRLTLILEEKNTAQGTANLLNMQGQVVNTFSVSNAVNGIVLPSLPAGIYLIQLDTNYPPQKITIY